MGSMDVVDKVVFVSFRVTFWSTRLVVVVVFDSCVGSDRFEEDSRRVEHRTVSSSTTGSWVDVVVVVVLLLLLPWDWFVSLLGG